MRWTALAFTHLAEILSPSRCAACDSLLDRRALLCAICASTVLRWSGDGNPLAFGHYGGALSSALLRLKYGNRPDLGAALGQLLVPVVLAHLTPRDVDLVIPVPVPYDRLVQRGYNQSALIGRPLASALMARLETRALARKDGSVRQAGLNRSDRLKNLQGAFVLRAPKRVRGKRVVLVDDVRTTGATLQACEDLLLKGGADVVATAVVARTEVFES